MSQEQRDRIAARLRELRPSGAPSPTEPNDHRPGRALSEKLRALKAAVAKTPTPEAKTQAEPIAIVGLSGMLPGCDSVQAFWQALDQGRSLIGEIPANRFNWRAYYDPRGQKPDSMVTRWGGFLPDPRGYDPAFFNTLPRQADYLDPRTRLLLMSVYHTLEDAGHAPDSLKGRNIALFLGLETDEYGACLQEHGIPDDVTYLPTEFMANTLSHHFDFQGPSEWVNSLCSSAAVALHRAVQALRNGEAEQAVVGAANLILRPEPFIALSRSGQMSPEPTVRSFGADARGFLRAEGVGSVLLKPLSRAERDGDAVYAVIRASAVNYNGRGGVSIASPNIATHAALIADCYRRAGVDPRDVTYIEAQGMGNPVADIAEWEACNQALRVLASEQGIVLTPGSCRISTLKPFCGHMHAASALGALFKIIHALHRETIAGILNFQGLSPDLVDADQPCRVAVGEEPWRAGSRPRLAGLHSYGAGGSNAHLLIEAYQAEANSSADAGTYVLPISADSAAGCRTKVTQILAASEGRSLASVARTLQSGRDSMSCRVAFTARTFAEWRAQATAWLNKQPAGDVFVPQENPAPKQQTQTPAALAQAWANGETVSWPASQARRLHLPGHPFQRIACWYDDATPEAPVAASEAAPAHEWATQIVRDLLAAQHKSTAAEINLDTPFQTLGFDSLLVVQLAETLHRRHNVPIDPAQFFEFTTPRHLAAHLARHRDGGHGEPTRQAASLSHDRNAEPIAIIGVAGVYPQAPDLETFWQNLRSGRDCIDEVPAERWSADFFDADPDRAVASGRSYGRWGGFLKDLYRFDARFFGITPREALLMNPKERILLQNAWHAMEDAGYTPESLAAETVGVFVGVTKAGSDPYPGTFASMANRISYSFDFNGPSFPVDTMCSSSLVAVHEACRHLRDGECSLALAGGVNAYVDPSHYAVLAAGRFLSPDGRCRSFGDGANGMVPGEGVGTLLLKPLSRAEQDGDQIYAVIRGSAINHGGRTNGFTVPNPEAHRALIRTALERAGVDARSVSYVEAHGTGTALGDPIEVRGLTRAFAADTDDTGFCRLGSVKSNIGHLEAAAGMSGIAKILLQMKHKTLVPSLHAAVNNRQIDFPSTPFQIQQDLSAWQPTDSAGNPINRIACISSFGAGGGNAHLVLEAYTPAEAVAAPLTQPVAVILSARDQAGLCRRAEQLAAFVETQIVVAKPSPCEQRQTHLTLLCRMMATIIDVAADELDIREPFTDYGVEPIHLETLRRQVKERFPTLTWSDVSQIRNLAQLADAVTQAAPDHDDCSCHREQALADMAYTLQVGRQAMKHRFACLTDNFRDLAQHLRALVDNPQGPLEKPCYRGVADTEPTQTQTATPATLADQLAEWVKGTTVDWQALHQGQKRRRISLPGYPFAGKTYRMENKQETETAPAPSAASTAEPTEVAPATDMPAWIPAWEVVPDVATATNDTQRLLVLCDLPADLPTTADRVVCFNSEATTPAERYTEIAVALFEHLRDLFQARLGKTRVQVVVPGDSDAGYAGLVGLLETARQENPNILCQLIEVDQPEAVRNLATIPAGDTHLRLRDGRLERRIWREYVDFAKHARQALGPWRDGATYLITGGLGALGLIVAREIAAHAENPTLILTGRSPLSDARRAQLSDLARLGASVRYEPMDVTRWDQVAPLLGPLKNACRGIVHCAGLIRDGFLLNKTAEDVRAVLAPKVAGTANLLRATRDWALDFLVLFSSGAGAFGNVGQADYAAANGWMDALAARADSRITAVNWPLWREGGMTMDAAGERMLRQRTGASPLQTKNGVQALRYLLNQDLRRLMVVEGDADVIRENLTRRSEPEPQSAPIAAGDALREPLRDQLCALLGETIGLDAAEIDPEEALDSYGIDSVLTMELTAALERVFGPLSKTLFYQYLNLADLGDFLLENHASGCRKWLEPEQVVPSEANPSRATAITAPTAAKPSRNNDDPYRDAVAVIGLSTRHPQAENLDDFWDNLLAGREMVGEVPADRWDAAAAERAGAGSRYGAFLDEAYAFDPLFFKMTPREAANIDPQERLFLQTAWHALEDAGYAPAHLAPELRRRFGVFVGITKQGFNLTGQNVPDAFPATSFAATANRVSYQLNLQGPSIPVDTMCASSLTALHEACAYLRRGDGDMALAGGVNLYLHPATYQALTLGRILARGPHCAAFCAEDDGFVPGEAVGAVVLKRYHQAVADRDSILGVIRGSAVNHGGRTNGFTIPNPNQQAAAIRAAIAQAGIDPNSVSYLEAAANGSPMGDTIEMTALTEVFGNNGPRPGYYLGSIKPSIGHGESASGISQLARVLMALRRETLPATLIHGRLNEDIPFDRLPFQLVRETTPWPALEENGQPLPRRAGISNTSAGGVNAHLIVEAHPPSAATARQGPFLFILSALSQERLTAYVADWRAWLATHAETDPAALAYTLQVGRQPLPYRLAVVADDLTGFAEGLARPPFQGRVEKGRRADRAAVQQALACADLERLAELWVAGHSVPWPELQSGLPRLSGLPTYPFARKICRIDNPAEAIDPSSSSQTPLPADKEPPIQEEYENPAAEFYAHATRGADENFQEEYLTFAPFEEKIPGFSSSRIWLDPLGNPEDYALMKAKQREMRQVLFCSEDFQRIDSMLDFGCGRGTDVIQVAEHFPHITTHGFTITKVQAELGNRRIAGRNLAPRARIFHKDSAVDPFPGRYDLVIGIEVSFHIRDKDALFGKIAKALKSGGRVLLMDYIANLRGPIVDHDVEVTILTRENWLDLLARHGLRISEIVDVSPQVANFLYDPECRENIKGQPQVTQNLWLNHANQATALERGWITYCLMKFEKEEHLDEAALYRHNAHHIDRQTPYPEAVRAMFRSGHIPYPVTPPDEVIPSRAGNATPTAAPAPHDTGTRPDRAAIRTRLVAIFAKVLGFEKREILENNSFEALGISSINAVELLEAVNTAFDLYLPTSIVFECNDLDSFSDYLYEAVPDQPLTPPAPGAEPPAEPRTAASDATPRKLEASAITAASPFQRPRQQEIDDVAVIGLACRCAGADDQIAFWQQIRGGNDCLARVVDPGTLGDFDAGSDQHALLRYGIMRDPDCFDPLFFHISPKEAEMMDYAQRILLEECYKALEDAGIAPGSLKKKRVGTYIGVTGEQRAVSQNSHLAILGADASILAARIAFYLDLKGPALAVNTACSSSLVAMDLAYRALQQGDIDLAIAGGITISGQVGTYASMNNAGMISPTGTCRPFDNDADGIVVGDGVGIVIMQRQRDAHQNRHHQYGVIRGSGTNQDGRTSGITVPGFLAQSELETAVYRRAGISAADIQYVEAHGTATKLGDPIEIHGLTHSFAQFTPKKQFCAIGSLKANIGHTAAAAGVLSAIKLLLSLKHRQMPPSIHFNRENEHIDFKNSPVYVNTELKPWQAGPGGYRLGAVSSFGYSGTNAHMLLSDPDPTPAGPAPQNTPRLLVLSARSEDRLRAQAEQLATWLQARPDANLTDVAYTLQVGRDAMNTRLAFVATNHAAAITQLNAWLAGDETDASLAHGQVQPGDAFNLFDSDDELRAAVAGWMQRGKLERLSALWTKGLAVDWDQLYATPPRRISLPGYAFKRERIPLGGQNAPATTPNPAKTEQPKANQAADTQPLADWDGFSFKPEWFPQAAPAANQPHRGRSILILSAGETTDLVGALARESRQSPQATVVRIHLAQTTQQLAQHEWSVGPESEAFATSLGDRRFDTVFFVTAAENGAGRNERALLHLVQHLRRQNDDLDLFVLHADQGAAGSQGSGLPGLACAIAQGSRIRVRNLSLTGAAGLEADLVTAILREPASERGEQVRFQAGRRQRRRFLKLSLQGLPDSGLRRNGTYLLVGGSGALGRVITDHLQQEFAATVIWIGRRDAATVAASGGVQPAHYFQADVTDAAALRRALQHMKETTPTLHGAVFAGLVYHAGNGITMEPARFGEMIDVKIKGSLNLYHALADEPLDFMCWFSSVQAFAFLSASDSAGYATGITAADSLVDALRPAARFPLGTVNWGYWHRSVAGTPLAARIQNHFETIADGDGFRFFSRFTGALRAGRLSQALYVGTSPAVRRLMACPEATLVKAAPSAGPALIDNLRHYQNERSYAAFLENDPWPELNSWMARLLFVQLRRLGLFHDNLPQPPARLRDRAAIIDAYTRWWDECCLGILETAGLLQRHADGLAATQAGLNQSDAVWDEWRVYREQYRDNRDLKAAVTLVESCLQALPEILRGERPATDVLFPRSSMEKVENLYQRNVLSDFFNSMVADLVVRTVQARVAADPNTRLRIVEIGAGTGGTTALVLPALKPWAAHIEEYCYTDVSRAFLMHAAQRYGADAPFLTQHLWNVEQDAAAQGLNQYFDIAVATNVLHATRDIRTTLHNVAGALKHNGLLILNENITKTTLGTLTFGLLDGWWRYEDAARRIPGCPLLSPTGWQAVLGETGWTSILPARDAARALGQQIIVAQSNGWVQHSETAPPRQATPAKAERPRQSVTNVKKVPVASADRKQRVTAVVRQALSQTLNLAPADIEGRVPFSDYGIDSILGVTFMDQINETLGIAMNTTILFDQTTVDALSAHILQHHADHRHMPATLADDLTERDHAATPVDEEIEETPAPRQTTIAATSPSRERDSAVAVIGIAGRFPGANDPATFWQNMVAGRSGIVELPEAYCHDGSYRWGGILADRHCFDPLFFHISPKEAELMNVHQRLVLEESWKALEDAGYNPRELNDSRTGIYIGAEPSGQINGSLTGSSDAIIASRLSYHLNLKGPAMVVNTGCSSSGVALHLACESLRNGETEMALAGGVFAAMVADGLGTLAEIEMLSPSGTCHTFDSSANGTVLSEGVGVVVLKRLSDALTDGDPIHGVIAASGVNQDGASNGITAPNGAAQERLMRDVYERFDINPAEIGYFEAHGTGTRLGDPVEANAMVRAFTRDAEPHPGCALGSAKSFIGHASAAAGVIGLIKILLSLKHKQLPPMLNFKTLNPLIEFEHSPFSIPTQTVPWPSRAGRPRTAALNSFGHSGTNAHLVVREHLAAPVTPRPAGPYLVVLSARDENRLREAAQRLAIFVADTAPHLADVAYTLQVGRDAMEERLAFLVENNAALTEQIQAFLAGAGGAKKSWFRGQVRPNREMISLLSDDDLFPTIDAWISHRRYARLLELWVRGLPVAWDRLYAQGLRPRRIHLPPYAFARNRYTPQTQAAVATAPTAATRAVVHEPIPDTHFGYLPRWEEVDALPSDHAINRHRLVVLVYNGESFRFENDLADYYRSHHPEARVIHIRLCDQTRQRDENTWLCNHADVDGPAACLDGLPVPDALFFIAPFQERETLLDNAALAQSIQSNEIQVLRFVKYLQHRMAASDTLDCYLLTVDNHADLEPPNPYGGGISGLACAIAQGEHRIRVRNLDLAREEMADEAERVLLPAQILAEPSSDRGDVIRLQYGLRRRRHFVRLDSASLKGSTLRHGGVYVILGGSGVVGSIISRYLIQEYAAKVVWIGRRPATDPDLRQRLAAFGMATPHYVQADVTDADALKAAVDDIHAQFGAVHGAVFSGLVFHPGNSVTTTDEAAFRAILDVKTQGSLNFYNAFRNHPLDFMFWFSSIQAFSFLAARDSAAYATGITFADTFARSLGETPFPVGIVNWGYWAASVRGTPLEAPLAAHFAFIEDEIGFRYFEKATLLLNQGVTQLLCHGPRRAVRQLMHCNDDEIISIYESSTSIGI